MLIAMLIIAVLIAIFLVSRWIVKDEYEQIEKNKKIGVAKVVNYRRNQKDYSSKISLVAVIQDIGDDSHYVVHSGKINKAKYPVGTLINVEYSPVKVLGVNIMHVRLLDDKSENKSEKDQHEGPVIYYE